MRNSYARAPHGSVGTILPVTVGRALVADGGSGRILVPAMFTVL